MDKKPFWYVMLVPLIGASLVMASLGGCGSSEVRRTPTDPPPGPLAKVVPPETKMEIPLPPKPPVKVETPPPSVPTPAPKKKKKG